ncbi:TPA: toprim domain-containing protein [Pseudomonas aeruginosa]|nr:toprim domain-containing protein [Pseudomonas aeruginosa]MBG6831918.1 toprim domain-containing protein [Pseudomonas aeruginosa]HCF2594647.1 toprim domain-containing protein [Pseudomonas aeruginosa]HEP9719048.1 toprim domain-containing protein [Pseudomonas aeruginosa]HEP9723864.1 toprim domain-containing protein [Pseudomonas aeruginosa]
MVAVFGRGLPPPLPDGLIHRFHVPGDRPSTINGWYVLHLDGIPAGTFGSWKTGETHHWSSRTPTSLIESQLIARRSEQARRLREAERRQCQQSTAEYARDLISDAGPADPYHPYLHRKGCLPHGLRQRGDLLLVLLYHAGRLVNLQRIGPDGSKRFLHGGRVTECYSPIGIIKPREPLYICEGWATGAALHEETGHAVACAMTTGNLLAVGKHLHQRHPDAVPVIAGDDDRLTEGNPGRTAAIKAAEALSCGLVLPPWCGDEPLALSDFNDLRQWRTRQ